MKKLWKGCWINLLLRPLLWSVREWNPGMPKMPEEWGQNYPKWICTEGNEDPMQTQFDLYHQKRGRVSRGGDRPSGWRVKEGCHGITLNYQPGILILLRTKKFEINDKSIQKMQSHLKFWDKMLEDLSLQSNILHVIFVQNLNINALLHRCKFCLKTYLICTLKTTLPKGNAQAIWRKTWQWRISQLWFLLWLWRYSLEVRGDNNLHGESFLV